MNDDSVYNDVLKIVKRYLEDSDDNFRIENINGNEITLKNGTKISLDNILVSCKSSDPEKCTDDDKSFNSERNALRRLS